jgi:hypothetical protein
MGGGLTVAVSCAVSNDQTADEIRESLAAHYRRIDDSGR